ncbi:hypothetical protein WR25_06857 [Diploscapter pachys]|uniref:C2H2-type domain-containing protein n=1 Tax=Diploscapter pachys TaxID=2018661 RepID=A0A2A2L5C4_9BILA|nr:hypothetical protein WR25_06857 [Diploscapter pachys]
MSGIADRNAVDEAEGLKCILCGSKKDDEEIMEQHLLRHFKYKKYACEDCDELFYTEAERHKHCIQEKHNNMFRASHSSTVANSYVEQLLEQIRLDSQLLHSGVLQEKHIVNARLQLNQQMKTEMQNEVESNKKRSKGNTGKKAETQQVQKKNLNDRSKATAQTPTGNAAKRNLSNLFNSAGATDDEEESSDEESPPRSRTATASRTPASEVQRQNVNRKRRISDLQSEKATDKPNSKQQTNADQNQPCIDPSLSSIHIYIAQLEGEKRARELATPAPSKTVCKQCKASVDNLYISRRDHVLRSHIENVDESDFSSILEATMLMCFPSEVFSDQQCTKCPSTNKKIKSLKSMLGHIDKQHSRIMVMCPFNKCGHTESLSEIFSHMKHFHEFDKVQKLPASDPLRKIIQYYRDYSKILRNQLLDESFPYRSNLILAPHGYFVTLITVLKSEDADFQAFESVISITKYPEAKKPTFTMADVNLVPQDPNMPSTSSAHNPASTTAQPTRLTDLLHRVLDSSDSSSSSDESSSDVEDNPSSSASAAAAAAAAAAAVPTTSRARPSIHLNDAASTQSMQPSQIVSVKHNFAGFVRRPKNSFNPLVVRKKSLKCVPISNRDDGGNAQKQEEQPLQQAEERLPINNAGEASNDQPHAQRIIGIKRSLSFSSEDDQGHEPGIVTSGKKVEKKKPRWTEIEGDRYRDIKKENEMDADEYGQRNANEQTSVDAAQLIDPVQPNRADSPPDIKFNIQNQDRTLLSRENGPRSFGTLPNQKPAKGSFNQKMGSDWETARNGGLQQKEKEDVEDPDVICITPAKMPTPPIVTTASSSGDKTVVKEECDPVQSGQKAPSGRKTLLPTPPKPLLQPLHTLVSYDRRQDNQLSNSRRHDSLPHRHDDRYAGGKDRDRDRDKGNKDRDRRDDNRRGHASSSKRSYSSRSRRHHKHS